MELIVEFDRLTGLEPESRLRRDIAELLQTEVADMNLENFIVRSKRRLVERYAQATSWQTIGLEQQTKLLNEVAGLPTTLVDDDLEAKPVTWRFKAVHSGRTNARFLVACGEERLPLGGGLDCRLSGPRPSEPPHTFQGPR